WRPRREYQDPRPGTERGGVQDRGSRRGGAVPGVLAPLIRIQAPLIRIQGQAHPRLQRQPGLQLRADAGRP
ncbi:UNVERIFIED_CONTAM: hypothetical protein GTU68_064505, partial [Idotea baltica]|nr:hypothetical protein [Idotea baltica]